MKVNRVIKILGVVAALGFAGCSHMPARNQELKGLFQNQQSSPNPQAPILNGASIENDVSRSSSIQKPYDFVWPVKAGVVSSKYGQRTRRHFHEGIDIRVNRGTPIYAAKNGKVIYSSRRIHGYGNMVVIQHPNGFATVYAHNKKNLVRVGDLVEQGDLIGYVGATGRATGPHLHFEVRHGEISEDPLTYLPKVDWAKTDREKFDRRPAAQAAHLIKPQTSAKN